MWEHGIHQDARPLPRPHTAALADGPKSQIQLDVRRSAPEALRREGLVYIKTHTVRLTTGQLAVKMWHDAKQEPRLRDCVKMTFDGITEHAEASSRT